MSNVPGAMVPDLRYCAVTSYVPGRTWTVASPEASVFVTAEVNTYPARTCLASGAGTWLVLETPM